MSCMVDGNPNSPLLVVGMSPGREELAVDLPFVGSSGKLLWGCAQRAGIDRSQCFIVNCIGELPTGKTGDIADEQFDKYWDQFNAAVSSFGGRTVMCLGNHALWRATGLKGGIEAWRGYLISPSELQAFERRRVEQVPYKRDGKHGKKGEMRNVMRRVTENPPLGTSVHYIIPLLHPAAILRSGFQSIPAFQADLHRVKRAMCETLRIRDVVYITSPGSGACTGPVAVDIETGGVGQSALTRIGIADEHMTWTMAWGSHARDAARAVLADESRVKIMHNSAFDAPKLAAVGCPVKGPWFDTMLAAQMLQPDLYKGLNAVASLYLDTQRWKHLAEEEPERYNAWDVQRTLELYHATRSELERTGQLALFEKTIMPTIPTLIRMTERGIKLDVVRKEKWRFDLMTREEGLRSQWRSIAGDVNPSSSTQLQKYLYSHLGLPEQVNKYGRPTTDETALMDLKHITSHPALDCLLLLRETSKLRGTYAENPLSDSGCVHPSYLPGAKDRDEFGKGMAGTGRLAARDPNIANQPAEARVLYIPHEPAHLMIEVDWSQAELRVAAALSGDTALRTALRGDVHEHTRALLGCDRVRAKNVVFGTIYGAGPRTLARLLKTKGVNTNEAECRALQDKLAQAYPQLWAWRQRIAREAGEQYHLTNPFGRRRYFYRGGGDAPAAIDFMPQSCVADATWRILAPLEALFMEFGGHLLATVYDSFLGEIHAMKVPAFVPELRRLMEQPWPELNGLSIPCTIKVGSNWGELKEVGGEKTAAA